MYKVMFVDDEPLILEGIKCLINWDEYGLEIAGTALNGAAALQMLQDSAVDILITDVKMPDMTGLQLIQTLKGQEREIRYIVLSGYDQFEFVKAGFQLGIENYLLKPINREEFLATLINTIDKISRSTKLYHTRDNDIIRDNILYRWVSRAIEPDELQERAALLDLRIDQPSFRISILKPLRKEPTAYCEPRELAIMLQICGETVANAGVVFGTPENEGVLIFMGQTLEKEQLDAILQSCSRKIRAATALGFFITVGNEVNDYLGVPDSYHLARKLQTYSLIMPVNTVLWHDETQSPDFKTAPAHTIDFEKFSLLAKGKDQVKLREAVDAIFQPGNLLQNITPSLMQNIAVEIVFRMIDSARTLHRLGDPLEWLECSFTDLLGINTREAMGTWLKAFIGQIVDLITEQHEKIHPTVKKALEIIQLQYREGLSLKTIAAELNINSTYLGQLFKNDTGEYFTDYLNNVRLTKAKELLETSPLSAREIAFAVGFTEPNYFYRIFKKYTGLSPTEYRHLP